jgi:hypothetical protein
VLQLAAGDEIDMRCIAPPENDSDTAAPEKRFCAADQSRANSGFKCQEYCALVLGFEGDSCHGVNMKNYYDDAQRDNCAFLFDENNGR